MNAAPGAAASPQIAVRPHAWPWLTAAVALAALVVYLLPSAGSALVLDRGSLAAGQYWRLWTGHLVHLSPSQLTWDLIVLVAAGGWSEWTHPRKARFLLASSPLVISALVLALDPGLGRYAGLSGVASAMLAFLAFSRLSAGSSDRWFWFGILGLLAMKILAECLISGPIFARFPASAVRPVPIAHLAGVAYGALVSSPWIGKRFGRNLPAGG